MQGARFITASEADSERGFDTRVIKLLTGDDTILARKLYEEHQEFKPQHKLWLAANHKPVVKEQTEGFWRRMRLVPFSAVFTEEQRDKMLSARLAKELPGILAWAVRGCQDWLENGLQEPSAIRKATLAYREENDILGEFLTAMCAVEPKGWTSTSALYQAFTNWWNDTRSGSQRPVTMGWFTRLLAERPEFKAQKRNNIRGWKGISLQVSL
jgi:putative DNA primase/helicase